MGTRENPRARFAMLEAQPPGFWAGRFSQHGQREQIKDFLHVSPHRGSPLTIAILVVEAVDRFKSLSAPFLNPAHSFFLMSFPPPPLVMGQFAKLLVDFADENVPCTLCSKSVHNFA